MKPTDVNHPMLPDVKVLFNNGDFSIVWGACEGDTKCLRLGMRWNELPQQIGFPTSSFGKPAWLLIHPDLSITFVTSLLHKPHANNVELLQVLKELLQTSVDLAPPL